MPDNKILSSFQQRRELMQAIDALGDSSNEAAMIDAAYAIVAAYPTDLILTTLIRRLATADSQLRGGLGHVAALLPAEPTTKALYRAVSDRQAPPEQRVAAAVILERYLEQPPPSAMMNDLDSSNEVAFQSLLEAIELGHQNRHVLLEYVAQMRQTETAVAEMVMEMLSRVPSGDRVEPLRLIAQDSRPSVIVSALRRLERLAQDGSAPGAVRALHTLQFVLPDEYAKQIKRMLRKLRFSGVVYEPPQPCSWRALVTPANPTGFQTVWLVNDPGESGHPGKIIGFVLNYASGIHQMFGTDDLPIEHLPPIQPEGTTTLVDVGGGRALDMLSAPFDYGRWLILEASTHQLAKGSTQELSDEYQLYNDLIWTFAAPVVPHVFADYISGTEEDVVVEETVLAQAAAVLLAQPSMQGWTRQNLMLVRAADMLQGEFSKLPQEMVVQHILREIAALGESTQLVQSFETGLRAQAAWLYVAGEEANAERAILLARHMRRLSIEHNPLLAYMITYGMERLGG